MAVLRRPAAAQVGPFHFTITFAPPSTDQERGEYGACDLSSCAIWINSEYAVTVQREVLLHELMHACGLVGEISEEKRYRPERHIRAVSPTLLDTLQRSTGLRAFLFA